MAKLSGTILLLVVVGTPLVAYVWATLNDLLSGHFHARQVLFTIPALVLLVLLLTVIARVVRRFDAQQSQVPPAEESSQ